VHGDISPWLLSSYAQGSLEPGEWEHRDQVHVKHGYAATNGNYCPLVVDGSFAKATTVLLLG
jgi:hypothetical protein